MGLFYGGRERGLKALNCSRLKYKTNEERGRGYREAIHNIVTNIKAYLSRNVVQN